jgi:hypothetical protein
MSNESTRSRIEVRVASIEEFNAWFERRRGSSVAVSGRYERRGKHLVGLGGLNWELCAPGVVVMLTTEESAVLPDLPVVLAMQPWRRPSNSVRAVAA